MVDKLMCAEIYQVCAHGMLRQHMTSSPAACHRLATSGVVMTTKAVDISFVALVCMWRAKAPDCRILHLEPEKPGNSELDLCHAFRAAASSAAFLCAFSELNLYEPYMTPRTTAAPLSTGTRELFDA